MHLRGPPLTDRDMPLLNMAVQHNIDYLAVTYISDAEDVMHVREQLHTLGKDIPIIAKVERPEAFARLDGILRRADGVMLHRGDLGTQIEITHVPLIQKKILRLANNRGVPAIIATDMLSSMVKVPRPTRAEASDVSNAIADGADGVVLSAESAIGKHPVASTEMMARIIQETELSRFDLRRNIMLEQTISPFADTAARSACRAAEQTHAKLIACFTRSGRTARLVAKYRPRVPVIAFCTHEETRQRVALFWGVRSYKLNPAIDVEVMVEALESELLNLGLVQDGDRIVLIFGAPTGKTGQTNSVRLHEIGFDLATQTLSMID
jgi:pyruvate kinase